MSSWIATALFLSVPVIVGGVLHMAVVKAGLLGFLAVPLHEQAFGRNKTLRGFVVMPLATVLGVLLAQALEPAFGDALRLRLTPYPAGVVGMGLGLAYVLFELPNSWLKRRLGVPPGKLPERNRALFFALDHLDSTAGGTLFYVFLFSGQPTGSLGVLWGVLLLGPLIHTVINLGLWAVGIRKQAN